jgi:hypothetical protein
MRRLAVTLVALAAIALPAAVAARPAFTQLQADAIARNVGLQAADLPDYIPQPTTDSPKEDIWGNGRVAHCMGRKSFGKQLADVSSPLYANADSPYVELIGSEVEVMPSAAIVRKDLKQAGSSRGRRCLAQELRLGNLGRDLKLVKSAVVPLSPPAKNGVIGFRLKLTYRTRTRRTVKFVSDVLAFGDGPIEAALVSIRSPGVPDRAKADQLLAAMRARADQQLSQSGATSPTAG